MHTTNIRSSERRAYGTLYWGAKFLNEVNPFQRLSQCHRCHDNRTGTELLRRSWGYLLVILLVLLVSLSGGLGDTYYSLAHAKKDDPFGLASGDQRTVKITLAGLGDAAAALLLVVLNDANLLEGLEDLAVDGAGGVEVVRRTDTTVLGRAVELAETADTDGLAEIDVAGDGGSADVEPVNVLGRELLGGTGLDDINPACNCSVSPMPPLCFKRPRSEVNTYREWGACPDASGKPRRQ